MDERLRQAQEWTHRAVFGGDPTGAAVADRALDAVEADLALTRGQVVHAQLSGGRADAAAEGERERALFERAVGLYGKLDDVHGEAEARFWLGAYFQVVAGDHAAAGPHLEQALALARRADDPLTASYALRHLGIAAHRAGRLVEARTHLEESTALRRALGFGAGVAANLVGLAYIAGAEHRAGEAGALLGEAEALAQADAAYAVLAWAREARSALGG